MVSQKYSKNDTLTDTFTNKLGYRYFIGARKISGNLQFGYSHSFISKAYDTRDLGYEVFGNKTKERFYIDYNTFKPKKLFRESYNSFAVDYMTNPETGKDVFNQLSLSHYFILKNYHNLGIGVLCTPLKSYNYDEPRVDGRFSRSYRYYYFYGDYSTDGRKALLFSLHLEYGDFLEKMIGTGFAIIPDIRYRVNDKLQVKYTFNYYKDHFNIGFADMLENGDIIYGGRELTTYVNSLGIQYLFKNDMSLSLNSRHYWNVGVYKKYYTLQADGELNDNDTYTGNNNFSYTAFYIDLLFSWQFAAGSNLSISYKNSIENENQQIIYNYSKNLNTIFDYPQTNGISIKLRYYLDYQKLRKTKTQL